jgi:hypothetical protein
MITPAPPVPLGNITLTIIIGVHYICRPSTAESIPVEIPSRWLAEVIFELATGVYVDLVTVGQPNAHLEHVGLDRLSSWIKELEELYNLCRGCNTLGNCSVPGEGKVAVDRIFAIELW